MVVDDHVDAADALSLLLADWGCDMRTAYSGQVALSVAATFQPDVVFLDLTLPGITGDEVCRRLKSESWGRKAALVALSGSTTLTGSTDAPFDARLGKPVDPVRLAQVLRDHPLARTALGG